MTGPALDPQLTAAILRAAADKISEVGLWRGAIDPEKPETGCTCVALAISTAAYRSGVTTHRRDALLTFFAHSVGLTPDDEDGFGAIIAWNDRITDSDPTAFAVAALHRAADSVLAVTS